MLHTFGEDDDNVNVDDNQMVQLVTDVANLIALPVGRPFLSSPVPKQFSAAW